MSSSGRFGGRMKTPGRFTGRSNIPGELKNPESRFQNLGFMRTGEIDEVGCFVSATLGLQAIEEESEVLARSEDVVEEVRSVISVGDSRQLRRSDESPLHEIPLLAEEVRTGAEPRDSGLLRGSAQSPIQAFPRLAEEVRSAPAVEDSNSLPTQQRPSTRKSERAQHRPSTDPSQVRPKRGWLTDGVLPSVGNDTAVHGTGGTVDQVLVLSHADFPAADRRLVRQRLELGAGGRLLLE